MTRISRPLFVMVFVAGLILAGALLLSTMINSAEQPIETDAPAAALVQPALAATA